MIGLSPTVAMASRVQRSGKTFTEVYADYVQLQEEYTKKCAEYDHMDRTLLLTSKKGLASFFPSFNLLSHM